MAHNEHFEQDLLDILKIARGGALNPSDEFDDLKYKESCLEKVFWRLSKYVIPHLEYLNLMEKNFTTDYLTDVSSLEYKETNRNLYENT